MMLLPKVHQKYIECLAFDFDGIQLLSGDVDGQIYRWNAASGELLGQVREKDLSQELGIVHMAFQPTRKHVAVGLRKPINADGRYKLELWEMETWNKIAEVDHSLNQTGNMEWSPDGRYIAVATGSRISLFDANIGIFIKYLTDHVDNIDAIAFSSSSKLIASGAGATDGSMIITEVESGNRIAANGPDIELDVLWDYYRQIRFLNDDFIMFTAKYGIYTWEISRKIGKRLFNFGSQILSHDGSLTAYVTHKARQPTDRSKAPDAFIRLDRALDSTIHVVDLTIGKEIHAFEGHTDDVTAMVFNADHTKLASTDYDGHFYIWDIQSSVST